MKLVFFGGINEIGGNKILLEDKDTKIFLDFGMNFNQHSNYFTEYMPPRKCSCITDMIQLGLLPDIRGIYREDYTTHMNYSDFSNVTLDGVLISHGHIDHVGYVHFLRKEIPIYVSEETRAIMELFTRLGVSGFEEFTEVKPSFKFIPKKRGDGVKRRDVRDGIEKRNLKVFQFGKKFKIGNLEIVPYRVDHSVPGATGFIIYTSKGPIVYTGDLRFHGRHSDWSYNFINKAKESEPFSIITEGTRIKDPSRKTEEYVQKESTKIIKNKKGIVIANFPIRDTERLLTFYNTAVANNRKLVIEYRQAMLLDLLKNSKLENLPSSEDKHIKIFYPKKSWGLIGREEFTKDQISKDYRSWEQVYLSKSNIISSEELRKNQKEYVLFMNYFQLNNLFDIKPEEDSVHIRSITEPFCEDMELDQKRINNWLKLFELQPEYKIHSSGHASSKDIFEMINTIKPKQIFPIHTMYPEEFKKLQKKVTFVKYNKNYSF